VMVLNAANLIVGNSAGLVEIAAGTVAAADVWNYVGASAVNKEDDLIKARKAAEVARNLSA